MYQFPFALKLSCIVVAQLEIMFYYSFFKVASLANVYLFAVAVINCVSCKHLFLTGFLPTVRQATDYPGIFICYPKIIICRGAIGKIRIETIAV